jgi:hypothetical protein
MELVHIAKALWVKKVWVAVGAVIAGLAALSVLYQIGPSSFPPQSKTVRVGAATTEVLIDSPQSALGDLKRDIVPLTQRGGIFQRFLATDEATKTIGKAAGLPASQIAVAGPRLSVDGIPDPKSAQRASSLGGARKYQVQVQQGDNLPVLSIFTSAPTKGEARKLADATATALHDLVTKLEDETGVSEKRRLTIRQLSPARAGDVVDSPSKAMAFAVFVLLLGAWCFGVLAWPSVVEAWRSSEPRRPVAVPIGGSGTDPFGHSGIDIERHDDPIDEGRAGTPALSAKRKQKRARSMQENGSAVPAADDSARTEAERLLGL